MPDSRQPPTVEELRSLFSGRSPIVIEVGCHEGQDTARFLEAWPYAQIYCFEPDPRAVNVFQRKFGDDERVILYPYAIAKDCTPVNFWASYGKAGCRDDWSLSGSIREPTGHLQKSPEIKFMEPVQVPGTPLDCLLNWHPHIHTIDFLWADVQGAQLDLFAGGTRTIEHTRYLYIECHKTPMYEGEPTQDELMEIMIDWEFVCMGCYEGYNFLFYNTRFGL